MIKKFWFYRDSIGPITEKYSPAEIMGTAFVGVLLGFGVFYMFF